jgi:hypothetical protein
VIKVFKNDDEGFVKVVLNFFISSSSCMLFFFFHGVEFLGAWM